MLTSAEEKLWRLVDLLQTTTNFFEEKGITNARLNAELLLCSILEMERVDLYVNFERPITQDELVKFREVVQKRSLHEPLQYILGKTEFMSLPFRVNHSVLIPRQDTEALVEWVIEDYEGADAASILDLGTGSGNIAISLAHYLPRTQITAVDVSQEALEVADENSSLNNTQDRVTFVQADMMDSGFVAKINERFDVIVSNPPYVPPIEFVKLEPEVRDFEPRSSLVDEHGEGTSFRRISDLAQSLLKKGGAVFVEVGAGQANMVKNIFESSGFIRIRSRKDYAGIERVVSARLKSEP